MDSDRSEPEGIVHTLHFLQHLQDLGVDEAYLNEAREIYAEKIAEEQVLDQPALG